MAVKNKLVLGRVLKQIEDSTFSNAVSALSSIPGKHNKAQGQCELESTFLPTKKYEKITCYIPFQVRVSILIC